MNDENVFEIPPPPEYHLYGVEVDFEYYVAAKTEAEAKTLARKNLRDALEMVDEWDTHVFETLSVMAHWGGETPYGNYENTCDELIEQWKAWNAANKAKQDYIRQHYQALPGFEG